MKAWRWWSNTWDRYTGSTYEGRPPRLSARQALLAVFIGVAGAVALGFVLEAIGAGDDLATTLPAFLLLPALAAFDRRSARGKRDA